MHLLFSLLLLTAAALTLTSSEKTLCKYADKILGGWRDVDDRCTTGKSKKILDGYLEGDLFAGIWVPKKKDPKANVQLQDVIKKCNRKDNPLMVLFDDPCLKSKMVYICVLQEISNLCKSTKDVSGTGKKGKKKF